MERKWRDSEEPVPRQSRFSAGGARSFIRPQRYATSHEGRLAACLARASAKHSLTPEVLLVCEKNEHFHNFVSKPFYVLRFQAHKTLQYDSARSLFL